jgi:hypothetical protein
MLYISYYLLCFSSSKLEKRAKQFLPGSERWGRREKCSKQCMVI